MDEAERMADRVAIVDHGRLLLVDTPANLKRSVGEGDVLEVDLAAPEPGAARRAVDSLRDISERINVTGNTLMIQARNLAPRVPEITTKVTSFGLQITAVTLRENTLEDVFIHLTGRKLRQ
jgi:ABC-2 type transport system ATP-binding protein